MTLARKLTLRITALIVAVALIAGASLWGLGGVLGRADSIGLYYEQLRAIHELGHHISSARMLARLDGADDLRRAELDRARAAWQRFADRLGEADDDPRLAALEAEVRTLAAAPTPDAALNRALGLIAELSNLINGRIDAERDAVVTQTRITITAIAGLALVTLVAAAVIGVAQYRSVMRPLRAFDRGMQQVADANFTERIAATREAEFNRLADRFNRMADRLDTMYATLEDEVNAKSRALIRSERLAGVGYLAAGLAHEINNPLGIIGGYAEAALARSDDPERTAKALRVIAEEAFRCKQITSKLLGLARPVDATPAPVDLGPLIERAADMMRDLPQFAGRMIDVKLAADDALAITGHEAELTQVMINLLANALEAVDPAGGRVTVTGERRGPWVAVTVADDGRGMDAATLERVFEPFFTDAPQRDRAVDERNRGTGLGLAVTHAIVTQHAGRIRADSPGPGRGSAFTLELPAASNVQTPTA